MNNDTIVAIATPLSHGPLGILRISGNNSINIISKIFRGKNTKDLTHSRSHTVHYGKILKSLEDKSFLDEALVTIMRSPNTYTKEDVVEISCHGNPIILKKILQAIIDQGARLAEPGEFTKRAFLNGRLDLSQAEAVMDIINAQSEESSNNALKRLNGDLSICINNLQNTIKEILISLNSVIDFPEDNLPEPNLNKIKTKLLDQIAFVERIIKSYDEGKIIKNGISVAIVGKANVGKSTLFNILTNQKDRSIVTPIPGTTRDTIDESVNINGIIFKFIDTAGLKIPKGRIEKESLERTIKCLKDSSIVLFVLDASKSISKKDKEIWNTIPHKHVILVINKYDLPLKTKINEINKIFSTTLTINISCKTKSGINELKKKLFNLSSKIFIHKNENEIIITNLRHKNILDKVVSNIKNAITALDNNFSFEFIANDIRHALENMQEITGERVTDTLLDDIFSKFCIGK